MRFGWSNQKIKQEKQELLETIKREEQFWDKFPVKVVRGGVVYIITKDENRYNVLTVRLKEESE